MQTLTNKLSATYIFLTQNSRTPSLAMQFKIISFVVCTVLTHFVQAQSVPPSEGCPQPKPGVIVNNPCKPLLDSEGIDISVEPVHRSSLYTPSLNIPQSGFEKWQFLRLDCSKRNGKPLNVSAISTYNMPYIIAMIHCTVVSSPIITEIMSPPNDEKPADILFSNCTLKSDSIPTKSGLVIKSSTLPPKFYTRGISKLVMLRNRVDSLFELFIDDKIAQLIVQAGPANPLEGIVHTQGTAMIKKCTIIGTKLTVALDSNPEALQNCHGITTKSTNVTSMTEDIRLNIDMMVLITFSLAAIAVSKYDSKGRFKPIASLSVSILSVYSAVFRILDRKFNIQQTPILLAPITLYTLLLYPIFITIFHSVYILPKLCRRYKLPNTILTWFLIILGPRNIELLWSNSLNLKIFSHKQPAFKSELLGLLELNRCIAIDIGVTFMTEGFRVDATVENILRNIAAVVSLLYTLHHWKVGRAYAKLGYFLLAIPALLNLALLFPDTQLGKTGYIIFMITLSIFTSTLIWATKFTAEESRYPRFIFSLGPIVVIGIFALFFGLAPNIYEGQSYKGWISVMSFMNLICLMTNICYYSKVWEKNMEDVSVKHQV